MERVYLSAFDHADTEVILDVIDQKPWPKRRKLSGFLLKKPLNRRYSQWAEREKFFERKREVDPDMTVWDCCALACENFVELDAMQVAQSKNTPVAGADLQSRSRRSTAPGGADLRETEGSS